MKLSIVNLSIKLALFILILLCSTLCYCQNWSRVMALPETEFTCIKVSNGVLYAASENKLYSTTNGTTWVEEIITQDFITPTAIEIFNNTLFIGTFFNGIYQKSLSNNVWSQVLNGQIVSSFAIHNNALFVATFGNGIYKRVDNNWINSNYNLPNFSYNVNKILSINNILYAFAGGNGTYYNLNEENLTWNVNYFFGAIAPGFITDDALKINNKILVSRGNSLHTNTNLLQNWTSDGIGLLNGNNRLLYASPTSIYVLTLYFNDANNINYTRIHRRDIQAPIATSWGSAVALLDFYSYGICDYQNKLYLATEKGVYTINEGLLNVLYPINYSADIILYKAINENKLNFKCDKIVNLVEVYDCTGKKLFSKTNSEKEGSIELENKGLYMLVFKGDNWQKTEKYVL